MSEIKNTKTRWLPLESNPDVMNDYAYKLGVSRAWEYMDVLVLDESFLDSLPQPMLAVLLLFPVTEQSEKARLEQEAEVTKREQFISPNLIFFRQTISNACGTIALLHSLTNNEQVIEDGPLKDLLEKAKPLSPEERAELLELDKGLASAHHNSALDGQTHPPPEDEKVNLHFICFVQSGGHMYELDGRRPFPIHVKKTTNLLKDAAEVIQEKFITPAGEDQAYNFNVIAFGPSQNT